MTKTQNKRNQYQLNSDGSFVIEDYSHTRPFSNFFPGVAGIWGIPMWVFYVNRGQGISSFGIESKDRAILEFQPANKAYRLTSTHGFRTFLKIKQSKGFKFYEPFQDYPNNSYQTRRSMTMTSHDLTIEESNLSLGLRVTVNYFTLPEEPYAALVRMVKIDNLTSKPISLEMIDGLPAITPYGMKDWLSKNMSRTVEAWVKVSNVSKKAPYYQLNVEVADTPQVTHIHEGNFYFGFESGAKDKNVLLTPVVDPAGVFGNSTDLLLPEKFLESEKFNLNQKQFTSNRTPSAMSYANISLKPKSSRTYGSLIGFAHDVRQLNRIVTQSLNAKFLKDKARRNQEIINGIKHMCLTVSAIESFNHYCGQTFLDNVLRGGLPISIETAGGPVAFNVYSRKHGDLERDYNFFMLAPTYLSQGNGNFRDVNQNRRNDVWFNKDVKDNSIVSFFNLTQADGYNPLVLRGMMFSMHDAKLVDQLFAQYLDGNNVQKIKDMVMKGFMPGDLLKVVYQQGLKLKSSPINFLTDILGHCQKQEIAEHSEGFWSDHWTYSIDLLESYLSIYPENLREILIEKKSFIFFFNNHYVLPRDHRYLLTKYGVRQYHSVVEKEGETHAKQKGFKLRTAGGQGEVYSTTLAAKLLCLIANKVATLDPSGIGVEMEADKPNWYDSLNGLPGLLGSAISETFEIKRYAAFLLSSLNVLELNDQQTLNIFEELAVFLGDLAEVLSEASDPLTYWKKSNDIKERYRQSIRSGISGVEKHITVGDIKTFLNLVIARVNQGVERARHHGKLFATYFYHEVTEYEILDRKHHEQPYVLPQAFRRHDLPLFLEGFVHALRTLSSAEALELFRAVKKSKLYDQKLGMYKVNANLSSESEEIGRTRVFPSGWLENESIWLHMEYKFLLELLRKGLYKEFFEEARTALVPFMDPAVYGRSILENSSFIASSAHEDQALHGQGFVARLSGSTAEFLHMWLFMNVGPNPFRATSTNDLTMHLEPVLPGYFFNSKPVQVSYQSNRSGIQQLSFPANTFAFNLMGYALVVYHNPNRKNTFGPGKANIRRIEITYPSTPTNSFLSDDSFNSKEINRQKQNRRGAKRPKKVVINEAVLSAAHARDIRDHKIERLDVYFE